ncbi:MAG: hypothetical protein HKN44_01935 [Ilumatobacter sp.]|nr:hypothetical protein [Ilumatobacter sp.]
MAHAPDTSAGLAVPDAIAAQLAYHTRMAAVFAVAGDTAESASEAVLAWAMLATSWDGAANAASTAAAELVDQDQASTSPLHRDTARARAEALALELQAHYVSVGLRAEAELYESIAERLNDTVATLVND